ncbi:hypothetical protein KI387_037556, partial [Taxus chinensis]
GLHTFCSLLGLLNLDQHRQIKFIIAKINQRIRTGLQFQSFQKLDESMTSIFRILNDSETKLTKQMNEATRKCSSSLKKKDRVFKEIKLAMQKQTDMQRQQFKDLQLDLLEIKSIMQTMATEKYKTCSCFSSKECAKYSVEESNSTKRNFSKQFIDNGNGKESTQKGKDVKDEKDRERLSGFHDNPLEEHHNHGLVQVACRIYPVHSHTMDEKVAMNIENGINSLQNDGEQGKPWNVKMTENAETTMKHIDCNDGANMLDDLPHNACPEIWKGSLFPMKKQENFLHLSIEKQNSGKCKNLQNYGRQFDMEVSPKLSISNVLMSQTGRGLTNNTNCIKEGIQYNRMGTELSTSGGDSNICNILEPSQACEGLNLFDKGILREELGRNIDFRDILGNRFQDSLVNKHKRLNSITSEKERSNMEDHTYNCKRHHTKEQPSMEEKKTKQDENHVSAKHNHCPSRKRIKCQAAWLRRPSHRFNESEVESLISAVEKLGTGRWRDVKEMYFSTFMFRTAADLK